MRPLFVKLRFDLGKKLGNKYSRVDFGLSQWGLKQQPGESYLSYLSRAKTSKLWQTKDNAFYDLTRDGATILTVKHHSILISFTKRIQVKQHTLHYRVNIKRTIIFSYHSQLLQMSLVKLLKKNGEKMMA